MSKLSGNKQTDFLILMKLTDHELGKVCQANKYINSLCNDDSFWMEKTHFLTKYSYDDALNMKDYLEFVTWKEYYLWLDKFKKDIIMKIVCRSNIESYFKLLLMSLKRKHLINDVISIYKKVTYPLWINKDEFLKRIKREFVININSEINMTDYEPEEDDDDYGALTTMAIKSIQTLKEQLDADLLPFENFHKFSDKHEIV